MLAVIVPPVAALVAPRLYGSKLTRTPALVPTPAGLWICIAMGTPVRSLKPAEEPYPTFAFKMPVLVSNTIPRSMVLPEPVLFVTAGTSLLGLRPTPGPVPGGESANWICAAWVDRVAAIRRIRDVFILLGLTIFLVVGCRWW